LLRVCAGGGIGVRLRLRRAFELIGERLLRVDGGPRIVSRLIRWIPEHVQKADIRIPERAGRSPLICRGGRRRRGSDRTRRRITGLAGHRCLSNRRRRWGIDGLRGIERGRTAGQNRQGQRQRQQKPKPRGAARSPMPAKHFAPPKPVRPHDAFITTPSCRSQGQIHGGNDGEMAVNYCNIWSCPSPSRSRLDAFGLLW
jgi:hypothetical protein